MASQAQTSTPTAVTYIGLPLSGGGAHGLGRTGLRVAYERTLAVARSIADLDGASDIDAHHVAEALQYRLQQRQG